jgi:hypothetical protein
MKNRISFAVVLLTAGSVWAADSAPKDDITAAIKKLAEEANYSWRTTTVVPEDARFKPGPVDGQTEKGGLTFATFTNGDNKTKALIKGEKASVTDQDGEWQAIADLGTEGRGWFVGMMVKNLKTPAVQAADIAATAKEIKKDGDVYSSALTEDGAKTLLTFRPRGGDGPAVTDPKGSVKFWIKDGSLAKYEFKVTGKVSFNGNDFDVDRATTIEVKDVGTTKLTPPEEAKKKLN